jgi:hypothetical protein
LITASRNNLSDERIETIKDPKLAEDWQRKTPAGLRVIVMPGKRYGPYRCPGCKKHTLELVFSGFWD